MKNYFVVVMLLCTINATGTYRQKPLVKTLIQYSTKAHSAVKFRPYTTSAPDKKENNAAEIQALGKKYKMALWCYGTLAVVLTHYGAWNIVTANHLASEYDLICDTVSVFEKNVLKTKGWLSLLMGARSYFHFEECAQKIARIEVDQKKQ